MFINVDTVLPLATRRARLLAHLNLANELAQLKRECFVYTLFSDVNACTVSAITQCLEPLESLGIGYPTLTSMFDFLLALAEYDAGDFN